MTTPLYPELRLTLMGVGGETIPLSRPSSRRDSGVFVVDVPDFMYLYDVEHQSHAMVGTAGAVWEAVHRPALEKEIQLRVRGRSVRQDVRTLVAALGDGRQKFRFVAVSPEGGYRWLWARLRSMSTPKWHGGPHNPAMCDITVTIFIENPVWERFKEEFVFNGPTLPESGYLEFPVDGDGDVWPEIELDFHTTQNLRIRLNVDSPWQTFQDQELRVLIRTHPYERSTGWEGNNYVTQIIPYWPKPCDVFKDPGSDIRRGRIYIEGGPETTPHRIVVRFSPEVRQGW